MKTPMKAICIHAINDVLAEQTDINNKAMIMCNSQKDVFCYIEPYF